MSWENEINAVRAEGGGLLKFYTIASQRDVAELIATAFQGDAAASRLLVALDGFLAAVGERPDHDPAHCLTCDRTLRDGEFTVAIVMPAVDDPQNAFGVAVCDHCGPTREAAEVKITDGMKQVWADVRPVTPGSHSAGHA